MKSIRVLILIGLVTLLMASGSAMAQRTSNASMSVSANNRGVFRCTLNVASFDFGDVDADGTDNSTVSVTAQGRNGADTGGTYVNDASSVTFECKAAPSSTAVIALSSTAADHTVGSMDDDGLEVRVPDTDGGTSTGYQLFTSAANLITGMAVGNGTNRASGDVDMRLTVLDVDPVGANTWVVRLRATGNP